ncbi:recombination protein RecR [Thiorhodococcus mannitoliphagus]|uniref:Recombination protein RecR n=1 Tax=Thiorhodococcus mannitoliphagus TaxID=329406 RepID=A0A6P1DTK4_9GAMM|nr:recombination mediator RecR [Thiorhodococcus mannitoliphagus]NEX19045.1 recombination protein RecR [Thiorhodococcus mannitoliphagus]
MAERSLLNQLIDALRCLPGVGPKSAQRIAFHLLERDREGGARLARVMAAAMTGIRRCQRCRTFTENDLCGICASTKRETGSLCVVEQPSEVVAIEQATDFRGLYFVLGGRLSPLDGIGPDALGLDHLERRLCEESIAEIILAISPTVEGSATAQFIADCAARQGVKVSRIAHGVPLGGELEYLDGGTLALAFAGRRDL